MGKVARQGTDEGQPDNSRHEKARELAEDALGELAKGREDKADRLIEEAKKLIGQTAQLDFRERDPATGGDEGGGAAQLRGHAAAEQVRPVPEVRVVVATDGVPAQWRMELLEQLAEQRQAGRGVERVPGEHEEVRLLRVHERGELAQRARGVAHVQVGELDDADPLARLQLRGAQFPVGDLKPVGLDEERVTEAEERHRHRADGPVGHPPFAPPHRPPARRGEPQPHRAHHRQPDDEEAEAGDDLQTQERITHARNATGADPRVRGSFGRVSRLSREGGACARLRLGEQPGPCPAERRDVASQGRAYLILEGRRTYPCGFLTRTFADEP